VTGRIRALGLLIAVAGLGLACVLSIAVGTRTVPVGTVWDLFWRPDGSDQAILIHELRIPRTVLALLVGLALGLAGAIMQSLTLNPLADPGVLGVNVGASAAVVVAISFLGLTGTGEYVWFALAGAGVTATVVFLLGSAGRRPAPARQIMAGVAVSAVLGSFVQALLVLRPQTFDRYRYWDVGSLTDRDAETVRRIAPFVLVGAVVALALARPLNALVLGDQTSRALGVRVNRTRALAMLAVTVLCGAATAAVGPIWFVGLAVPHVARRLAGPDHRWLLAYSAVLAATLMLVADVLGRVLVRPGELQVGIVTAIVGAPIFIMLARRPALARQAGVTA
jgi:iron complex transport system permease protein